MPLIPGICTQCGATLSVDQSTDCMICPYCHTPFIVQKAINQFNNTYNINAQNVYIQETPQKDFVVVAGVLEKYTGESRKILIPDGIVKIGHNAFHNNNIVEVIIPESVTKIDDYAFSHCSELRDIVIPNSVIEIGYSAFAFCTNLTEARLPNNLEKIERNTFACCSCLKQIKIPDSVTNIEGRAFVGCESIEFIEFCSESTWQLDEDETFPKLRTVIGNQDMRIKLAIRNPDSPYGIKFWSTASNSVKEASAKKYYQSSFAKAYYQSQGRCDICGGNFSFWGTCKNCGIKKRY